MTGGNKVTACALLLLMCTCVHTYQGSSFWSVALRAELLPPSGKLAPADCDKYYSEGLLTEHQYQICLEDKHILAAIARGLRRAVYFCQEDFKDMHWNCTAFVGRFLLGRAIAILESREAVYARTLISAAIAYDIATACREKQLPKCPCSTDLPFITRVPDGTVLVGGCGDNIGYAASTVQSFVNGESSGEEEESMMDEINTHNHHLAMDLLNDTVVNCRCHGFSTGCNIKTCTHQLHEFKKTGKKVFQRYSGAVQVQGGERGQLVPTIHHANPPTQGDMLFTQDSPNYCTRNHSMDIMGTHNRLCSSTQASRPGSCGFLCCGRGYYTKDTLVPVRDCKLRYNKVKGKYTLSCSVVHHRLVVEHRCR